MSIQFPNSRREVADRAKADVQSQLPTSNPFLKNSFLGALITGFSGRVYEFYLQLQNAILQIFPDTATGSYLERWGSYVAINRNPATTASGAVIFTGTPGTVIPSGTTLSSSDGNVYTTTAGATVATGQILLATLTRSGSTATATCIGNHTFATGMSVTISGATQTAYNGSQVITVTSPTTFTFTVAGAPTSPATGTITAAAGSISVNVISTGYGDTQNLTSGTQLTLNTGIAGAGNIAYVTYAGISGGSGAESDANYRARVIYKYQNPIALFNVSAITSQMTSVPGVTRVWVNQAGAGSSGFTVSSLTSSGSIATVVTSTNHGLESGQMVTISGAFPAGYNITAKCLVIDSTTFAYVVPSGLSTPATGSIQGASSIPAGQVQVFFTRDNDVNGPIPTPTQVAEAKANLLTIKPAHVSDNDVLVTAPVALPVAFTFTELTPNTPEMKEAIVNSLTGMFNDQTGVGTNLNMAAYQSAIWQAITPTGLQVKSFTLSTPTTSITVAAGRLPVLGTVTWP